MDQTDAALLAGFLSSPVGGVICRSITEWSGWVAYPVGGILAFIIVSVSAYALIGRLGKAEPSADSADKTDTGNKAAAPGEERDGG